MPDFLVMPGDRMRNNGHKLKYDKFHFNSRRNHFLWESQSTWNRLPRELLNFPYLEKFKTHRMCSCVACLRWPCRRIGLDDLRSSLPTISVPCFSGWDVAWFNFSYSYIYILLVNWILLFRVPSLDSRSSAIFQVNWYLVIQASLKLFFAWVSLISGSRGLMCYDCWSWAWCEWAIQKCQSESRCARNTDEEKGLSIPWNVILNYV